MRPMRPSVIVVVMCALMLAIAYYAYRQGSETAYRKSTLNEIDGMATAWDGMEKRAKSLVKRTAAAPTKLMGDDLAAIVRANEESAVLRGRFLAFETRMKAQNSGELPPWVKDAPGWQRLDRVYRRSGEGSAARSGPE